MFYNKHENNNNYYNCNSDIILRRRNIKIIVFKVYQSY